MKSPIKMVYNIYLVLLVPWLIHQFVYYSVYTSVSGSYTYNFWGHRWNSAENHLQAINKNLIRIASYNE